MTTINPATTARREHLARRVDCPRCGNTGVIERLEPRYIGHGRNGEKVYSAVHKVLQRSVCQCRAGWNQKIGADA